MSQRHIFAVLMLMVCLSIFGQTSKNVSISKQPQKTSTQVANNQQETILQLQAENDAMQKQLEKMEKDIELYRGDVRAKEANVNECLSHWLAIMTLMITVVGIAVPVILNYRNEKSMEKMLEDVKKKAEEAEKQAKDAKQSVADIEIIKEQISKIQEKINADTAAAEKAAKEAKASQLFTEAFNEKDTSKAIELYNQAIDIKPDFSEAYNNRGLLKKKINDQEGALQDYNKAIELNPNFAMAYNNRGVLRSDMNDEEGALQDYNKAIELDPNNEGKYNNRADLYLKMNDFDKALADVNHSIDLGGGYVSFITKGEIYIAMEKYSDAIELFTQALSYNEKGKESFEYRAKCYRKLAEAELDEDKKKELISKAEADEQKAESLKKESKA